MSDNDEDDSMQLNTTTTVRNASKGRPAVDKKKKKAPLNDAKNKVGNKLAKKATVKKPADKAASKPTSEEKPKPAEDIASSNSSQYVRPASSHASTANHSGGSKAAKFSSLFKNNHPIPNIGE
jgi:hypothetical protein